MMNRKRWKHVIAAVMCATLVLSAPAVYAADEQPNAQTEEKAQDTEQKKEEVKEEATQDTAKEDAKEVTPVEGEQKTENSDKATNEDTQEGDVISAKIDYDGTKDIVLNFTNGTNDKAFTDFTRVRFVTDGTGPGGGEVFDSISAGTDFTYDISKSEIVIKKEFVNKHTLVTFDGYYVIAEGTLADGTKSGMGYIDSDTRPAWRVYCAAGNLPVETPDENGFVIKDGVLVKYTGTASEVTIPEGVISIGERAFFQNKNITSLTFPSSLKSIGEFAFENCSNLIDFSIPSNITYIGRGAFSGENQTPMKMLTIYGNNTTIGPGAFFTKNILEIVLEGNITSIGEAAFDAQSMNNNIKSFTVNGAIENLGDIFPMTKVEKFIVNGDIKRIEGGYNDNIFFQSKNVTIYGKEGSYIQEYAKERNISFEVIEGTPEEPSTPQHVVDLTKGSTSVTKSDMQDLVNLNQTQDIVIKSTDGVVFTFPKGSMKMMDGKENYDFGVQLITDFNKVTNTLFNKDTFAFQINYNYEGELPGTANISIPVDSKWSNQMLYYYRIYDNGTYKYLTSAKVDSNGIYTISQTHCSDYVATTQAPDSNGNPTKPADSTNNNLKTSPKTGDTSAIWLYLALMMGAGVSVVIAKRKSKIK